MSRSPAQIRAQEEMDDECRRLVAITAMEAAEAMPTSKRIMIHHGIAAIFPKGSPEHERAKQAAWALRTAEKKQLRLSSILTAES